jgi:hypothetical protein
MPTIKLPLRFEGSLGEKRLYALFDSGATFSCISGEAVENLEERLKLHHPLEVATASAGQYLKIEYSTRLDFYYEDIRLSDEFIIVPSLSEDVVLGVNTFQKWRIKLDFEYDKVHIDPKVAKAILK